MSYANKQTHTSSGEIAISRDRYNMMWFSVIGLGLALIVAVLFLLFEPVAPPPPLPKEVWIEEQLDVKIPLDVVETLKKKGIETVVYIGKKGEIRVTEPDGTPVEVCADVRGTEIVERPGKSCGQEETPEYLLHLQYYGYNPGCTSGGGKLAC